MLLTRDLDSALPVMRAIGVRELTPYLRGEISLPEAVEAGRLATRQYAKRQYTWFRNQSPSDWPRILTKIDDQALGQLATSLRHRVV